jgi:hypothetical protein
MIWWPPEHGHGFRSGGNGCHCNSPTGKHQYERGYDILIYALAVGIVEGWKASQGTGGQHYPGLCPNGRESIHWQPLFDDRAHRWDHCYIGN